MSRPATVLVTGFTKCPDLARLSLEPIVALKRKGVVNRILAVTWDSPSIDAFVSPVTAFDDVELVRVPQPQLTGPGIRNGIVYQIRNLEAALALVPDPAALVLKMRPDFVADPDFLENKIVHFDRLCAPSDLGKRFNVQMPPSPFSHKIWVPWADSNQPFFYEDGAFMGRKRDVQLLASREAEKHLDVLTGHPWGWYAHILRFLVPFLPSYPIFNAYIRAFRQLPNDLDYRRALLPVMTQDSFFWHLLLAHAWILATSFHVDCGRQGELALYTNTSNARADWSSLKNLQINPPYDKVQVWRDGQRPGGVLPGAGRAYGRVVDDSWQHALFTSPTLTDLTPDTIRGVLNNLRLYPQGLLDEHEKAFHGTLETLCRQNGFGNDGARVLLDAL